MDGGVGGQLRVKSSGEKIVFLNEDGLARVFGKNIEGRASTFNDGATNEDHLHWPGFQLRRAEENVAGDLAAVGVTKNSHVHQTQRTLRWILHFRRKENSSRAGAEDCVAFRGEFANCVVKAFFLQELKLGSAFAARKNQAVAVFKVGDGADFNCFRTKRVEHRGVGFEVALNS